MYQIGGAINDNPVNGFVINGFTSWRTDITIVTSVTAVPAVFLIPFYLSPRVASVLAELRRIFLGAISRRQAVPAEARATAPAPGERTAVAPAVSRSIELGPVNRKIILPRDK